MLPPPPPPASQGGGVGGVRIECGEGHSLGLNIAASIIRTGFEIKVHLYRDYEGMVLATTPTPRLGRFWGFGFWGWVLQGP